jgi:hypothetical protein
MDKKGGWIVPGKGMLFRTTNEDEPRKGTRRSMQTRTVFEVSNALRCGDDMHLHYVSADGKAKILLTFLKNHVEVVVKGPPGSLMIYEPQAEKVETPADSQ